MNTHGGKGRNIACDLHNEHVNKLYKEIIGNMGANFTEFASTCAARAVSSLERLALGFERQTGIHPEATAHSRRSDVKDVQIVAEVVLQARILEVIDERYHSKFPNFSSNPLNRLDREKMIIWIQSITNQITTVHDSPDSGEWLAHAHQDLANRYQALFFVPANFYIKIGPGDEAKNNCVFSLPTALQ